ncbi:MAG: Manganese-dependent superoxide dismutase [Bacteroidota bacterium]|jgi:Fe-Mn family superoxide dismutase
MSPTRREFLKNTAIIAAAGATSGMFNNVFAGNLTNLSGDGTEFSLPPLPYSYDALEPHIDRMTMEIHHTKHHQAYVTNLNKALKDGGFAAESLEELLKEISKFPAAVRNNAGGHWNHSFFWQLMKPGGGGVPSGKTAEAINQSFGSFEDFRTKINEAGMKRFGSGWAWLVKDKDGKLVIGSTPNQDNPLMDVSDFKGTPVLGIDVWEHAYYLKYQNRRGDYLSAWWNLIDWDKVGALL